MSNVYLGLGSNVEREKNIAFALKAIGDVFGEVVCSPIYESEAVGFEGSHFYNLVVKVETQLPVAELSKTLREIEDKAGRDRSKPKFSPRTLDIDILLVDDLVGEFDGVKLPRDEILKNAFVLLPLSEIAASLIHPEVKKNYFTLWREFDNAGQKLWRV